MKEDAIHAPIYVVMAVYSPDAGYLDAQVQSLANQSTKISRLVVVIADCASAKLVRRICDNHQINPFLVEPTNPTPSYKSFEIGLDEALKLAPENALFAFCDQDDLWVDEKLARSARRLRETGVSLVHCDAEVVDAETNVLHASLFRLERRQKRAGLRDLLLRNSVTGMCAIFTRETARAALPFPTQSGMFFHHDLWTALVAESLNGIEFLDEALVKYRQHEDNVVGSVMTKATRPPLGSKAWMRHWVGCYGVSSYLAKSLYIRMEEIVAAGAGDLKRRRLNPLKPYLSRRKIGVPHLYDAARLCASGQWDIAYQSLLYFLVRVARLVAAVRKTLKDGTISALSDFDKKIFAIAPGAQPGEIRHLSKSKSASVSAGSFEDRRAKPQFEISIDENMEGRFVVLVPSLNPSEIFAGIATAIDIGIGLARRGHRVAFVATDLPVANSDRTLQFILDRAHPDERWLAEKITVHCGLTTARFDCSPQDRLMATAWWTAHLASEILKSEKIFFKKIYYLIQDFEPGFYPWGAEYAGALDSYRLEAIPIFNTGILRDYFASQGFYQNSAFDFHFRPSIDVDRYKCQRSKARGKRTRFALYGRPEVARNLFPLAIESIGKFLTDSKLTPDQIELVSVGLMHDDIEFLEGHRLRSFGKIPWCDYPEFLRSVDVGLSLMLSPHPSHPPLEMAASGVRVVTNSFSNKNLCGLSENLISVGPSAGEIASGLRQAMKLGPNIEGNGGLDLSSLGPTLDKMVTALSQELAQNPVSFPEIA